MIDPNRNLSMDPKSAIFGKVTGERVHHEVIRVVCPGCGEETTAVAYNGVVKGYCSVARKTVEALQIIANEPDSAESEASPESESESPLLEVSFG